MDNNKNCYNENFSINNDLNMFNSKFKSFSQNKHSYPISIRIQKTFEKTIPESFDLSNSYKMLQNFNRNISEDLNYNKSNSNISNSISNLDLYQKNESFFIKMRIGETKDKILIMKKNLNKKTIAIETLQEELKEIKIKKENKKKELENLLSNKESFELIYNSLINDNWDNNSQRENFNKIKLDINDLENCLTEKLIEQIKIIFKEFSIIYDENNLNEISNEIKNNYSIIKTNNNLSEEEIINKYLNEINEQIKNIYNNKIPKNQIELIIKYIIKLLSLDNRIQENYNFIFKTYKERKKEIKIKISELINTKQFIDEKIEESRNNISKLENKIHLYGQFSRNKVTSNQFRTSFLAKECKTENLKNIKSSNSNKNTTRTNIHKSYKRKVIKKELKLTTSPRKLDNLIENFQNNINDNNNAKIQITTSNTFSNRLKIPFSNQNLYLKKGIINQSFCYFKLINKNDKKFNPLYNFDISPEVLGYYKGFIYIDFTCNLLLFTPLPNDNNLNNKVNESLKINLRKISNIHIENIMRDIIKIYINALKFYKKYENNNYHYIEENVSLNKFIHLKEFNNIDLDTNQRIKATQNKYFPFSISLFDSDERFEIIFIDYNEFINWYKGIEVIVNNNKKGLHKNKDERILQNIQNSKKNNSFSYNNYYDNLFI